MEDRMVFRMKHLLKHNYPGDPLDTLDKDQLLLAMIPPYQEIRSLGGQKRFCSGLVSTLKDSNLIVQGVHPLQRRAPKVLT